MVTWTPRFLVRDSIRAASFARSADYGEFQTLGNADIALCQAAPMQSDPEPNGLTLAGIG